MRIHLLYNTQKSYCKYREIHSIFYCSLLYQTNISESLVFVVSILYYETFCIMYQTNISILYYYTFRMYQTNIAILYYDTFCMYQTNISAPCDFVSLLLFSIIMLFLKSAFHNMNINMNMTNILYQTNISAPLVFVFSYLSRPIIDSLKPSLSWI